MARTTVVVMFPLPPTRPNERLIFFSHQDNDSDNDNDKTGRSSSLFLLFLVINETHTHRDMGEKTKKQEMTTLTPLHQCAGQRGMNKRNVGM